MSSRFLAWFRLLFRSRPIVFLRLCLWALLRLPDEFSNLADNAACLNALKPQEANPPPINALPCRLKRCTILCQEASDRMEILNAFDALDRTFFLSDCIF
jgi:hypothetical protein